MAADPPGPHRRLYVVAVSHLDTQWRWTVRDTIRRHLPKTLRDNVARFAEFPSYVVSFDGAFRYALLREHDPAGFAELRRWVAAGRWGVAGCTWDAADVNLPSPESLVRQVLHARRWFARELGARPRDLFLPDGFGFGWALPSIAAHCGLHGFSSQKLSKGRAAAPLPFPLGVWEGPDGAGVVAALEPGGYGEPLRADLHDDPDTLAALDRQGAACGVSVGLRYFGVGDTGGAPDRASLRHLERSVAVGAPIEVRTGPSGRLFDELTAAERARLPRHRGELLLAVHGTGCYTSQAAMKRWNRKNELLADAAERASVVADWLGGAPYPRLKLERAWRRFLWHQFHDDLTGTSVPAAYALSWNDELLAANELQAVLADAVGAVARALDTRAAGVPLVVFNPLSIAREDLVGARLELPGAAAVRVVGPDGAEVPAQAAPVPGGGLDVTFLARLPALGFAVYDVRPSPGGVAAAGEPTATSGRLANGRYEVALDRDGDVASLRDRALGRELLAAPLRLELLADASFRFPAWEIRHRDVAAPPRGRVGAPARVRVVETGPARATLEVRRRAAGSEFTQRLSLAAGGAGDRLEIAATLDWRTRGRLLKARFPFALADAVATYDLGLGAIERGVNTPRLYEVPAQQWADLTAADGSWGAAVLEDCKYGWDRPDPGTLRLTLLHTPRVGRRFRHQGRQDLGRHRLVYAVTGHGGDWRDGGVVWQAARLNQPLIAFGAPAHAGALGRVWAPLAETGGQVAVRALKRAEEGEEVVLRLQELHGRPARATVGWQGGLAAAREVDGVEEPRGAAPLADGSLDCELLPWQPRAFALRLAPAAERLAPAASLPIPLPFDLDVVSLDADRADGEFEEGASLPGELLPAELAVEGVRFVLGPSTPGRPNALSCRGQRLGLPAGGRRLYLLAAVAGATTTVPFTVDGRVQARRVPRWCGFVGQWDRPRGPWPLRLWRAPAPAWIERTPVAWVGTHRHLARGGDDPYACCYLFKLRLDLEPGVGELVLPRAPRVRLLAATRADDPNADTRPATDLYD